MGRISGFRCPSCGMSWTVQLGHGMGHAALESVLDVFPEELQQKILADTQGEQFPWFGFDYHPAVCWHCRKVAAVPMLYLHQSGNTYAAPCPDCGNLAEVFTEAAETVCPYCGNGKLTEEDIGNWD